MPPAVEGHSTDPGGEVHLGASAHIWTAITGSDWELTPCFNPPLAPSPQALYSGLPQHNGLKQIHEPTGDPFWTALREALDDHTRHLHSK
ncbi:hypothetical protein [Kitasatospora aureofaciens]|uniref:hypothetical protein n=1 Tax=Kitasatospora aureofaciens TaxID=1894 RepID=UPI002109E43A|nr:hypothetical protein [Kitasatospora aureofaciens]